MALRINLYHEALRTRKQEQYDPLKLSIIGLIVVPFLIALIYVITRGRGMAERRLAAHRQAQAETDQYIQSVASTSSPAEQITSAKALLDSGSITPAEFDHLKAKALA